MRMVDLIRAQKGKKVTPRPPELAPSEAEPKPEQERADRPPTPSDDWRAAMAKAAPAPEESPSLAPGPGSPDELYAAAEECLGIIFNAARRREPFTIEAASQMAERFGHAIVKEDLLWTIKESFMHFQTLVQQTLTNRPEQPDLVRHGLNVAIYALKVGTALEYPADKMKELALAAFCHDIGLIRVPEAVRSKPGPLLQSERTLVQQHPSYGYEILRGLGSNWEWLAEVVLQHHEREDGTGYPKRLRDKQIHEYAQIIGISEIYEAVRHARSNRRALAPVDAVKEILQTERACFPQAILKAFINGLSSYPVGSWVRISTKEVGRVIATSKHNPLRPVLEVLSDASGGKLPQPRLLDLSKELLLYITGPVTEEAPTG